MSLPSTDLIRLTPNGLYCEAGDFYVDPWRPVDRAVITHAHSDHARRGHTRYLAHRDAEGVLRNRLGDISLDCVEYGDPVDLNGVRVSLHPAGHVLGSAQVRIESRGEVWVLSGDYKLARDPTCRAFEPVRAHTFVTESTFGLPVYRWRPEHELLASVNDWWRANADAGRASVLFAYAFGKAQRLIAGLDPSIGPIVCHGAVETLNEAYRAAGVPLPPTLRVTDVADRSAFRHAIALAPPSAQGTTWLRRFGAYSDAFASGWMQLRGARRRNGVDRGFVVSDHADWPGLQTAIRESGAHRVFVTHGYVPVMVRWLTEQGLDARAFETQFGTTDDEADTAAAEGGDAA
ncbi:MAG: ligase-associated DNA damage response exonuclease [Betaproteobacteria bacterium]|nr:ligase-associated DNA damage response exonuclease [Betaproteobacteria bacterium]